MNDQALVKIDIAKTALAEAKTIQEVKRIVDLAEAARVYAQRSKAGKEVEMYAVEITVLAERKLGEMLTAAKVAGQITHAHSTSNQYGKFGVIPDENNSSFTLKDAGIEPKLSSRAQTIATIPANEFQAVVRAKAKKGTLTRSAIVKQAKREQRKIEREKIVARPLERIIGPFDVILADPPWRYTGGTTTPDREIDEQYPTADLKEIISHKPQSAENAVLFLWATAPLLIEALEVLNAWGFTYKTNAVWDKERIGLGYWFRIQHEHLLVGLKGKVSPPPEECRVSSIFQESRTIHSRKPESVFQWIDSAFPGRKRLEMYARQSRPGWASWGFEI